MNEHTLQLIASLKIVWVAVFSYLYGEGGINNNWLRRFLGAAWMMLGIFVFSTWQGSWSYWYLAFLPICIGGLHNGYGASETFIKLRRRAFYGFCLGLSGLPLAAVSHLWGLFGLSVGMSVVCSMVLGAFNPCRSARDEETLVACTVFLMALFLI